MSFDRFDLPDRINSARVAQDYAKYINFKLDL